VLSPLLVLGYANADGRVGAGGGRLVSHLCAAGRASHQVSQGHLVINDERAVTHRSARGAHRIA
jgi:hypothetical protein